jgi:hypothetical protein
MAAVHPLGMTGGEVLDFALGLVAGGLGDRVVRLRLVQCFQQGVVGGGLDGGEAVLRVW